jgi:hypothetical protein
MTHRLFGAVAVAALASFAAATPGSAKFDSPKPSALIALQITQQSCPALKLAMGPTSAPQKPGGTGEAPADTQLHKATKHKHKHSWDTGRPDLFSVYDGRPRSISNSYPRCGTLAAFPFIPAVVLVAMKIMKVMLRAYDKRAELFALVTLVMVLAIGTLAKFDAAAALLFHHGHWASTPAGGGCQSEAGSGA